MASPAPASALTTEQLLRRSQQYDASLVFHANLSHLQLRLIGSALNPCASLTVLNLSHNRLTSLSGLQSVAATLQYLDASENELTDITALHVCTQLRRLSLQGNQLRDWQAVETLAALPSLRELTLRAEIRLDGDPQPLVLDNPVCGTNLSEYVQTCAATLPQLEWLDGVLVPTKRPHSLAQQGATEVNQQAAACAEAMKKMTSERLSEKSASELALERLVAAVPSI